MMILWIHRSILQKKKIPEEYEVEVASIYLEVPWWRVKPV